MRPDAEPPLHVAHEVRAVVRHAHVVDDGLFAVVDDLLDRHPLAVVAAEQVARLQLQRRASRD
jgi:hypothetical protein